MTLGPVFFLFVITVVAWTALEFWLLSHGKRSISGRIWQTGRDWPPLLLFTGLVIGILLAHFFFGQCGPA